MENSSKLNRENRQRKKLRNASHIINSQKKLITTLSNIISSWIWYLPWAGPLKSLGEWFIWKDFLSKRQIKWPEQLLKIIAGISWLTGYSYIITPYLHGQEVSFHDVGRYATLELVNAIVYSLSLLVAGGEEAKKVKNIKSQLYHTLKHPTTIIKKKWWNSNTLRHKDNPQKH